MEEQTDPDNLATMVCAILRTANLIPTVRFRFDGDQAVSIEVLANERGLIATFPIRPMKLSQHVAIALSAEIEAAAKR